MSKPDRTRERQAKNTEREMDTPNMDGVLTTEKIGRTSARETTLTQTELAEMAKKIGADIGLAGFENFDDRKPVTELAEGTDDEDPALQELLDAMQLPGNGGDTAKDGDDNKGQAAPTPAANPAVSALPTVAELLAKRTRSRQKSAVRLAAIQTERATDGQMREQKDGILEVLDTAVFPDLEKARRDNDRDAIREALADINRARQNKYVAAELDKRKAAASHQRLDECVAAMNKNATVTSAYEGVEALKADHSLEPILPALTIQVGTMRPNPRRKEDQNAREFKFITSPLTDPGVVQIQLFVKDIADPDTGKMLPTMFYRVVDESGNLFYRQYTHRRDGELGVMRLGVVDAERGTPPRHYYNDGRYNSSSFVAREENRAKDPGDAVKDALGRAYSPDYREVLKQRGRQRGAELLLKARDAANVSARDFVLNGAVGTMVAEATILHGTEHEKPLAVALVRDSPESVAKGIASMCEAIKAKAEKESREVTDEEGNYIALREQEGEYDFMVVAYEPSSAFYALRGAQFKVEASNLDPETGKGAVNCWAAKTFKIQARNRLDVISQTRELGILLKTCVLAEMRAQQEQESAPQAEAEASLPEAEQEEQQEGAPQAEAEASLAEAKQEAPKKPKVRAKANK